MTHNRRIRSGLLAVAAAIAAASLHGAAQERDRAQIADRYKWNLTDIYPSVDAWRAAKERIQKELPKIGQFKGKLVSAPSTLADALDTLYAIDKELSRAFVYVGLLADQDTREAGPQGMRQEMVQLNAAFAAEASYMEPEILKIPKPVLEKLRGLGTAAEGPSLLPGGHRQARPAYAERFGRTDSRRGRSPGGVAVEHLQHPVQCRLPVSDGDTQRGQAGQARCRSLQRPPGASGSCRPPEGDVVLLPVPRELQPHVRNDDEQRGAEGAVLLEGARVSVRAGNDAGRPEHSDDGLHAAR